jgi:7,8-dihydropterin-6-yl-methyl-4-(beta-D-ribofuranosyl)aminobenzene 5'-phosphate synthase
MKEYFQLHEAEKVEIITLQDNYIDITATDNNSVITRAMPLKGGEIRNSILAEHGFSALIRIELDGQTRTILFDFGFSQEGAAFNAKVLEADMSKVEALVLSHSHGDHLGGMESLIKLIGRQRLDLYVHPAVFKSPRYIKISEQQKVYFPRFTKQRAESLGVNVVETRAPRLLLDAAALFLGEIPRLTAFEKGLPTAYFQKDGMEYWDPLEDDTSVVIRLREKGLVVLSGCAHSGIVNTVQYAKNVTGIDKVHVVMGGFHLNGPLFEPIIARTTEELKKIRPDYVIPCHCTGRKAIMYMEKEMQGQFILNMSGTKLAFTS